MSAIDRHRARLREDPTVSPLTRRDFMTVSAAVIAGVAQSGRAPYTALAAIPETARRTHPAQWLPDAPSAEQLRALAAVAMETTRAAGADFSDIRIGVRRFVNMYPYPMGPIVGMSVAYGIRAWHGGTWSFQHGNVLTADAVATTARSATAGARLYAGIDRQLAEHRRTAHVPANAFDGGAWASTPVVTGEWRTPLEIDPFIVSIDDYQRVLGAVTDVRAPQELARSARFIGYRLGWRADSRIFASQAGSMVTQDTVIGGLIINVMVNGIDNPLDGMTHPVFDFADRCAGFETALRTDFAPRAHRAMAEAIRWIDLPRRTFSDVGRFPVVFDGATASSIIGETLDAALDGDRVSGIEADASGGSFLAPPLDTLRSAEPIFSPLLTLNASRALPSSIAVRWDDDGVVPEPYTVVDRGRVVDFHTTRESAPLLAEWYTQHGRPVRSHGGALAPTCDRVPSGTSGHVTVTPSATPAGLDELARSISHGFLVVNGAALATPGLTAGSVVTPRDAVALEIRNGVPVARTRVPIQFVTRTLLGRNLVALGDGTTLATREVVARKGIPWQEIPRRISAPALFCKDVDITE